MKPIDVIRRRMGNTRLTGAPFHSVAEVVRWHGAMQGQDYGPAKWSIGQRTEGLTDGDVDAALNDGSILRTHALRPTWHLVAREDIRWILSLTAPRVRRSLEPRLRQLGLDSQVLRRSTREIGAALAGGNYMTRTQIAAVLDAAKIDRTGQRLPHILLQCELQALICSGPLAGKQQTFALVEERAPTPSGFDREEAMVELVRRYLQSHGPATVADLRWWSSLTVADIKRTLQMMGSDVVDEELAGMTFWSLSANDERPPPMRGAHLLQMLDEAFVGYSDSRHFGDPLAVEARSAWSERGMPAANILVRGHVAGHWQRTVESKGIALQLLLYHRPEPRDMRALEAVAKRLGRFVGLPVTVTSSFV
jgi:hypothetical protein